MKNRASIAIGVGTILVSTIAIIAATKFTPNSQPWGYIAPVALSTNDVQTGTAVAYAPWFESGAFQGDVYAYPVSSQGVIDILSPLWNARGQLALQDWNTGRNIVTTDDGTGIPFRWNDLDDGQKADLDPSTDKDDPSSDLLDFIRGDSSNEKQNGGDFHNRHSVLGSIIHSPPVYVAAPNFPYTNDGYLTFANGAAATRSPRLYVGANDGMLHAFDAATGQEMFGYIPEILIDTLPLLQLDPYAHQYYVDGTITVGDYYDGSAWHSVLVGGLGAGGKGFYALDVTTPTTVANTEEEVAANVMWEYDVNTGGKSDLLGFTYGRPSIVRLNSNSGTDWGVVVPNGYMSDKGGASLHILDIKDGKEISILEVGTPSTSSPNGLSSPVVADLDGNGTADVAYAGDLDGNVWKFDLSGDNKGDWKASLFYVAKDAAGARLSIIGAPEVSMHPTLGVMLFVATGRHFSNADAQSEQVQSVFGLRDNGTSLLSNPSLVTNTLSITNHASGQIKVATDNQITTHLGWRVDLPIYENVVQDLIVRDSRVQFLATNAKISTGENWLYELDFGSGGSPGYTVLDINGDKMVSALDNVDFDGNGSLLDAVDIAVAQQQSFGLASRPTIVNKGNYADVAIINHLQAINPAEIPPPVLFGEDLGLVGGHFDLDTTAAGGTHDWEDGSTHNHDHEWDDKTNRNTVDYFNIVECEDPLKQKTCHNDQDHLDISDEIKDKNQEFYIVVSNAELSSGAVLELNGVNIDATTYQSEVEAALAGSGSIPRYSLSGANGSQELTDLKVSFGATAIINGGLHPTSTGCVKGNDPGKLNEYRNGAFTVQAVDANMFATQVNDTNGPNGDPVRGGKGTGLVKHIGGGNPALLWESTLFWHWDGGCYGTSEWDDMYTDCFVNGNIQNCTNSCWPGRRTWKIEFSNDVDSSKDWEKIEFMSITLTTDDGSQTSTIFSFDDINDQDENDNIQFGTTSLRIDMSQASMKKKVIEDIVIMNIGNAPETIASLTVNWTGTSNMQAKEIIDTTPNYGIDPLSEEKGNHAKGAAIPLGGFVLEESGANFCTINSGEDGEMDDFGQALNCNQDQLTYRFDKILTDAGASAGTSTSLTAEFTENVSGIYYWVIDFTVAGVDKQVVLNLINGASIDSISGDVNFLDVSPTMSVSGNKQTATVSNVSSDAITITELTVAWISAPDGQQLVDVEAAGSSVYTGLAKNSGQVAALTTPPVLGTTNTGAGPDYHVRYTIDSGSTSIEEIFPAEHPTYDTAALDALSPTATTLGLDGFLSAVVNASGRELRVRLTNNEAEEITVTIDSVTWANASPDQQFREVAQADGKVLFNNESGTTSGRTYPINKKFKIIGTACQNDGTSLDTDGDGSGSGGKDDGSSKDGSESGTDGSSGDGSTTGDAPAIADDTPMDPDVSVSDTTQAGGSSGNTGRMKWREVF